MNNNNGFFGKNFNFGKAMGANSRAKNNGANVNMENESDSGSVNWLPENGENVNVNMQSHVNRNSRHVSLRNNANVRVFSVPDGSFKRHQGLKNSTAKEFLNKSNNYKKTYSNRMLNYQKHLQNYNKQIENMRKVNPNLILHKYLNQNIAETVGAISRNYEPLDETDIKYQKGLLLRQMLSNNRVRLTHNNLNNPGNSNNTRRRKSNARNKKNKIAKKLINTYSNF